jgi:predicted alpha/beta hydrolase family esterase
MIDRPTLDAWMAARRASRAAGDAADWLLVAHTLAGLAPVASKVRIDEAVSYLDEAVRQIAEARTVLRRPG